MNASSQTGTSAADPAAAKTGPAIFRAPDGLEIAHHSLAETKYVYREIFEERVYFRHGINLLPDEPVFDVGANIGLFTMFVKEHFPSALVHAFEPSPVIFPVLQTNVSRYGKSVVLHSCGVAGRPGQAVFTFYPNYSIMSGFHAHADDDRATLRAGIKSYLLEQGTDPAEITNPLLDRMVKVSLRQTQEYVCQLRTISEILSETASQSIGLLKIDAEGGELDILAGIRQEHWGRIRQIVMEIHNPEGETQLEVEKILKGQGYDCLFEKEKCLSESGIVNCYARRI